MYVRAAPLQFHSSGCKMDDFPTFVSTREEALSLKKRFEIKSGIKFVRSSDYSANNEHGVNIRFVDKQKVVRNNDHPFSIVHTDTYECMYGRERHAARKQRIAAERELCLLEEYPLPLKRAYKKSKASRKKGCPAKLVLKEVVMYTDYKLDGPLTEATNWQKKVVSRDLRAALDKKIEIKEEVRVYLKYPTDEEHQSVHQVEQNHIEETPMFDPVVLEKLKADFQSTSKVSFNPPISPANPGNNLLMRPLHISDYDKGYLQLLAQLTTVGNVPRKLFEEQFHAYKACPNSYYIVVIEDIITGEVVATGTLGIDFKFTHMCSQRGKLDEIVVKEEYRGKQLGKLMVETLTLLSQQVGCYKTTLECKTENIPFYSKFGYEKDPENYMSYRHEHCSLNKEETDS